MTEKKDNRSLAEQTFAGNVVTINFYVDNGFTDKDDPKWTNLPEAKQRSIKQTYEQACYQRAIAISGGYME